MTLRVVEIFGPTIQGEGALIGEPTVFVRTGGCDYRCSWCDSLHAVDSAYRHDWKPMSAEAIIAAGMEREQVQRVLRLVDLNEYKRRQAPPGVRITRRAFGRDRRYPITSGYGNRE